jgi:hypothetical protein
MGKNVLRIHNISPQDEEVFGDALEMRANFVKNRGWLPDTHDAASERDEYDESERTTHLIGYVGQMATGLRVTQVDAGDGNDIAKRVMTLRILADGGELSPELKQKLDEGDYLNRWQQLSEKGQLFDLTRLVYRDIPKGEHGRKLKIALQKFQQAPLVGTMASEIAKKYDMTEDTTLLFDTTDKVVEELGKIGVNVNSVYEREDTDNQGGKVVLGEVQLGRHVLDTYRVFRGSKNPAYLLAKWSVYHMAKMRRLRRQKHKQHV